MHRFKIFIIIFFLLGSCIPYKNTIYLQDKLGNNNQIELKKKPYTIFPHDLLYINITSGNSELSQIFNLKVDGEEAYSVNDSGYILMPVLDSVYVVGKTISEIQFQIRKLIREHVTDAIVIVKLAQFKVTVLGEVLREGNYSASSEEFSVFDAIGIAGGVNDFGNRKKVNLVRKEGDSTKLIVLDLTDRNIINSEFFFLHPNDLLYVEPIRAKNIRANASQISLFLGILSFVYILNNILKIF